LKSGLLNGVSLISIWIFEFLVSLASRKHGSPADSLSERGFVHRNLGWFYQALWLGPIVGASLYLNVCESVLPRGHCFDIRDICLQSAWCNVVARRAFTLQHGNRAVVQQQPVGYAGMLNSVATSAYRAVMIFSCALLSAVLSSIPLSRLMLGPILAFAFFCWVDS
jgi:etoposide-induced 2.4 mRNA